MKRATRIAALVTFLFILFSLLPLALCEEGGTQTIKHPCSASPFPQKAGLVTRFEMLVKHASTGNN